MKGKFKFTREVPSPIGGPINFESRRKSLETKRKRKKEDEHEMEKLHTVKVESEFSKNTKNDVNAEIIR